MLDSACHTVDAARDRRKVIGCCPDVGADASHGAARWQVLPALHQQDNKNQTQAYTTLVSSQVLPAGVASTAGSANYYEINMRYHRLQHVPLWTLSQSRRKLTRQQLQKKSKTLTGVPLSNTAAMMGRVLARIYCPTCL